MTKLSEDALEKREQLVEIAGELTDLLARKADQYGYAFEDSGEILRILAPEGVSPDQYPQILFVARVLDKLFRIMKGGSDENPVMDIAGYCLLELNRAQQEELLHEIAEDVADHDRINLPAWLPSLYTR